jgi:hypothetical protein
MWSEAGPHSPQNLTRCGRTEEHGIFRSCCIHCKTDFLLASRISEESTSLNKTSLVQQAIDIWTGKVGQNIIFRVVPPNSDTPVDVTIGWASPEGLPPDSIGQTYVPFRTADQMLTPTFVVTRFFCDGCKHRDECLRHQGVRLFRDVSSSVSAWCGIIRLMGNRG